MEASKPSFLRTWSPTRIIASTLVAWGTGLALTLLISFMKFETPGIQDVIGFGSYLLIGTILIVPLFYLPMLWLLNKELPTRLHLLPLVLGLFGNAPLYILLWLQRGEGFFFSEAFLFMVGFFMIAFVFGAGLLWNNKILGLRLASRFLSNNRNK